MKTIILIVLVAVSGCVEEANLAEVQCHEVLDTVCALGEACRLAPAGKTPIYSPPTPEKCAAYVRSVCAKKVTAAPQADVDACLVELDTGTCTSGRYDVSDAGQQCIATWDK